MHGSNRHEILPCAIAHASDLPHDSIVFNALASEMTSNGTTLLTRMLLEEPRPLVHSVVQACCRSLLHIVPPEIQFVRDTLDQIASALAQLQPLLRASFLPTKDGATVAPDSTEPKADEAMLMHAKALAYSVTLLTDAPLPCTGQMTDGEEAIQTHQQWWTEKHGSLLPLLEELGAKNVESCTVPAACSQK